MQNCSSNHRALPIDAKIEIPDSFEDALEKILVINLRLLSSVRGILYEICTMKCVSCIGFLRSSFVQTR